MLPRIIPNVIKLAPAILCLRGLLYLLILTGIPYVLLRVGGVCGSRRP